MIKVFSIWIREDLGFNDEHSEQPQEETLGGNLLTVGDF